MRWLGCPSYHSRKRGKMSELKNNSDSDECDGKSTAFHWASIRRGVFGVQPPQPHLLLHNTTLAMKIHNPEESFKSSVTLAVLLGKIGSLRVPVSPPRHFGQPRGMRLQCILEKR